MAVSEYHTDIAEEQALVARAAHEPEAWRLLYGRYFPRLYSYASYRLGTRHDAEDVVAETFLRAVGELERFEWRHEGSFAAWLFRIAHNVIATQRRERRRAQELPLDLLPDVPAHSLLPAEIVERKELFAQLLEIINGLSARRREVLTLRFFGGLQNKEIAAVLGLDERTVASHLCRGLEDLQRKYAALSGEREE